MKQNANPNSLQGIRQFVDSAFPSYLPNQSRHQTVLTPAPLCDIQLPPQLEVLNAAGNEHVSFGNGSLEAVSPVRLANGQIIGHYRVAYRGLGVPLEQLMAPPPSPPPPMDQPNGIYNPQPFSYWTWIFEGMQHDQLFAVGMSIARLVPLRDGSYAFMISAAGYLVGGTGGFTGATGVITESGAAQISSPEAVAPGKQLSNVQTQLTLNILHQTRDAHAGLRVPLVPQHHRSAPLDTSGSEDIETITGAGIEIAEVHQKGNFTYIVARGEIADRHCKPIGEYVGTFEIEGPLSPQRLMAQPPQPETWDDPRHIPKQEPIGALKVTMSFSGGNSIIIAASAIVRLFPQPDGSQLLMIVACGLVTGGTGDYSGAAGVETESGIAMLPPGQSLTSGARISFRTNFVAHIVRRSHQTIDTRHGQVTQNIRNIELGIEKLNQRDFKDYFKDYSPTYTYHLSGHPPAKGLPASQKAFFEFAEAYPDATIEINQIIGSGNTVASRYTMKIESFKNKYGTTRFHQPILISGSTFVVFQDGLRQEQWEVRDELPLLRALGQDLV